MTTYEALMLCFTFGMLIIAVINAKKITTSVLPNTGSCYFFTLVFKANRTLR